MIESPAPPKSNRKHTSEPCPFNPGDRVEVIPDTVDKWCMIPSAKERWRKQRGTVADMGWACGRGRRLYVLWDGNKSPSYCEAGILRLVGDEWGAVEPATTG